MADQVRIFVSHSHQDNEWCREFIAVLQAAGWDVWYDEKGLGAGAEWVATIQREVQARDIFLLVLTPDGWDSRWVQEELNLALATHKRIIPVVHKQTQARGFLLTRQWVDVVGMPGAEAARHVADVLGRPSTPSVTSTGTEPVVPLPRPEPAPVPLGATPALHLTPTMLYNLGFRGYTVKGVECMLPPLCPVPGGVFTMGSDRTLDKDAYDDETPQYPVMVGNFAIGQHPVTVAECACAVQAKGMHEPAAWTGITWAKQLGRLDHPVVCASWQDALTYARWLARVTGQPWRLPTEAEWEKAARGIDGRLYPWGDTFDNMRCNTSESGVGTTTPVGSYPHGGSPYGALDMAGNVREWTSSLYRPYAYNRDDGREDLYSTGNRVMRGGDCSGGPPSARAACRSYFASDYFFLSSGFRLAWSGS
jgi:toxoflavin biosynthesis protein ToxD